VSGSGTRLDGRRAIVTGGSGGIGAAVVRRLASEGAVVTVVDLDGEAVEALCAEVTRAGDAAEPAVGDVTDATFVDEIVLRSPEPASVLVNCAGIRIRAPILDLDAALLLRHLSVNTIAPALWTRAVAKRLVESGSGGSVVNVTSVAAHRGFPQAGAYTTSKTALLGYSRCAAIELAPHDIRVNCVAPGLVRTPMTADVFATGRAEGMLQQLPLRRPAEPSELAGVVVFLASDDSSYVTGATFSVDGGHLAA
jgi:NAD(P)-dependent dehydrogenase (short-subunit alcohol dehydrogenase family)